MIFHFPAWKHWIFLSVLTLASILRPPPLAADGLSIGNYIQRLEVSQTPEDFNAVFSEMVTDFKSGRIAPFTEEEIKSILAVTRDKPFVESLLPAVYGWAVTVFGNGKLDALIGANGFVKNHPAF